MAATMRAMRCVEPGRLEAVRLPLPEPGPGEVRVRVEACAVCRTDLHVLDGDLPQARYPVVPGHEVVGRVEALGEGVDDLRPGQRVGVPWLASTCGRCERCRAGQENLCPEARFTGCSVDGGYAEALVVDARYAFPLDERADPVATAPLLCAGLIGLRTLRMAGDARTIGIYGFGAAAHIVVQVARHEGRRVLAFTRPGDRDAQAFARSLGAAWAGPSDQPSPEPLDAALIFAPVGALVPRALADVRPGGTVVCGGIHMSDIPSFPYRLLWEERVLRSVANLTRRDGLELLALAPRVPIRTTTRTWPLEAADEALEALRAGRLQGAAVLVPGRAGR